MLNRFRKKTRPQTNKPQKVISSPNGHTSLESGYNSRGSSHVLSSDTSSAGERGSQSSLNSNSTNASEEANSRNKQNRNLTFATFRGDDANIYNAPLPDGEFSYNLHSIPSPTGLPPTDGRPEKLNKAKKLLHLLNNPKRKKAPNPPKRSASLYPEDGQNEENISYSKRSASRIRNPDSASLVSMSSFTTVTSLESQNTSQFAGPQRRVNPNAYHLQSGHQINAPAGRSQGPSWPLNVITESSGQSQHPNVHVEPLKIHRVPLKPEQPDTSRKEEVVVQRRPRSYSVDSVLSCWDGVNEENLPNSGELKSKTFSEADIHNSSTLMVSEDDLADDHEGSQYADNVGLHIISDTHFHKEKQRQDLTLMSRSVENIPQKVQKTSSIKGGKLSNSKSFGNLTDFSDGKSMARKIDNANEKHSNSMNSHFKGNPGAYAQRKDILPAGTWTDPPSPADKMSVHVVSDTHLQRQKIPSQNSAKSNSLSSSEATKGSRTSPDGTVADRNTVTYQPSQDPSGSFLGVDKVSLQIISDTSLHHNDSLRSNASSRPSVQKRRQNSIDREKSDSLRSQASRMSDSNRDSMRTSGKEGSPRDAHVSRSNSNLSNSSKGSSRRHPRENNKSNGNSLHSQSSRDGQFNMDRRASGTSDSKSRPVTPKSSFANRYQPEALGNKAKSRSLDNLLDAEPLRFTTFKPQFSASKSDTDPGNKRHSIGYDPTGGEMINSTLDSPRAPPRRKKRNRKEGLDSDSGACLLDSGSDKSRSKSDSRYPIRRRERGYDVLSSSDYASDSSTDVRHERKTKRIPSFGRTQIPEIRYQKISDSEPGKNGVKLPRENLDLTSRKQGQLRDQKNNAHFENSRNGVYDMADRNESDNNPANSFRPPHTFRAESVPKTNGFIHQPVSKAANNTFTSTPLEERARSFTGEGLTPVPQFPGLRPDQHRIASVPNISTALSASLPGLHPEDSGVLVEEDYIHQGQGHSQGHGGSTKITISDFGSDLGSRDKHYSSGSDLSDDEDTGEAGQDPASWNSDQVIEWCRNQGFPQLAYEFVGLNVTGKQLLNIRDQDLVDLGIKDPLVRQQVLDEVKGLRLRPNASNVWRLQQTSMKRRTLETSGDLIKDRLYNLQELNSRQQDRINTSLQELQEQQHLTSQLLQHGNQGQTSGALDRRMSASAEVLSAESPSGKGQIRRRSSIGDPHAVDKQLEKIKKVALRLWSANDVQVWLKAVGLNRFVGNFAAHDITGRNLAEINMQLFDEINIESVEDRELILAKLYELQHPEGPSLEEIFRTPDSEVMPRSKVKVAPSGSNLNQEKKNSFHKKLFGEKPPESDEIKVYHDVSGKHSHTTVRVLESTTANEVLNAILAQNGVTDDYNLFQMLHVALGKETGEKELGKFECPLTTWRLCRHNSCRFEIRKCQGNTIKVICKMTGVEPRGKVFQVSHISSCTEVLQVALRKFQLKNADPSWFRLMEIDKDTGDVRLISKDEVILDLQSDSFILCAGDDTEELLNLENLPSLEQQSMVRRSASLSSHGSSAASQVSGQNASVEMVQPRQEKLENLEAQMANIEASLVVNENEDNSSGIKLDASTDDQIIPPNASPAKVAKKTPRPTSAPLDRYVSPRKQTLPSNSFVLHSEPWDDEQLELLREIALLKESISERDSSIESLHIENERLEKKVNEMSSLEKRMSEVEEEMGNRELLWQAQLHDMEQEMQKKEEEYQTLIQTLKQKQEEDPKLASLKQQLKEIEDDIQTQEQKARSVQNQLQQAQEEESHPEQGMFRIRGLERELSSAETQLMKMKQKHAELYSQQELTRREQEKQKELAKSEEENTLFDFVFGTAPQLITYAEVKVTKSGFGFMVGRDREHRPVIKHVESGRPLRKGDRLMEIDGKKVYHLEDADIQRALRQATSMMSLVVLRDLDGGPFTDSEASEVESLKEDLSLAVIELESVQLDNQDLNKELKKLENIKLQLLEEKTQLESKFEDLRKKLEKPTCQSDSGLDNSFEKLPDGRRKLRFGDDFGSAVNGLDPPNGKVIAYEFLDDHIPLWESLQNAPEDAVLQVLKDHILETSQQKAYLDSLLATVIEQAPGLLVNIESQVLPMHSTLLPHSEEFC